MVGPSMANEVVRRICALCPVHYVDGITQPFPKLVNLHQTHPTSARLSQSNTQMGDL